MVAEVSVCTPTIWYVRILRRNIHTFLRNNISHGVILKINMIQSMRQRLQSLFSYGRFELTLPNRDAMPPHLGKRLLFLSVPFPVAYNLGGPEVDISLRHTKITTPLMSMPEASVDKNHSTVLSQHQIRMSRQPGMIEPVSEPTSEQKLPHQQLRLGVLTSNRRHAAMPLFLRQRVHNQDLDFAEVSSIRICRFNFM